MQAASDETILTPLEALDRAIEIAGGTSKLAKALGIGQSNVSNWRSRDAKNAEWKGPPAEFCPGIERATGVPCEDLRPDVSWGVLRCTKGAIATARSTA
jgi:DNA-binding transcriptional regulator YdaS (Cro superfamily)